MPAKALHGLDRDVYQIVRKFEDEHDGNKPPRFTVDGLYNSIKRSNSSLARLKKRPLEDSIERILRLRKEERSEIDDEAALEDQSAPTESPKKERDYFIMNKHITKAWDVPRREAAPATPDPASSASASAQTPAPDANPDQSASAPPPERQLNGEPKLKRRKAERNPKEDRSPPTGISIRDLGGMNSALRVLNESVTFPVRFPELCVEGGLDPARGVLLHGPPGCGKTMLANAYAAALGIAYIPVSAPSLVAGMSGESEKKIRELYDEAKKLAPCLIFIDEIDAIMGKRENAQREMEKRIVAQMLTCMDDLNPASMGGKVVVTLAATNRPDSIDPALRRAGRFNREIAIGIPNEPARAAILRKILQNTRVAEDVDYRFLAKRTPGFVGADLKDVVSVAKNNMYRGLIDNLVRTSIAAAESDNFDNIDTNMDLDDDDDNVTKGAAQPNVSSKGEEDGSVSKEVRELEAIRDAPPGLLSINSCELTMEHLAGAIGQVQPSAKREGFTTIPDTTWEHIGALRDVREQLMLSIVRPIQQPERFARVGIQAPSGVLLWGPPGCGKTLLAKAVANESKANFISVKGPELLNKYVGESERSVRQVFGRARASSPCILFFDELDALVPRRDGSAASSDASARVVNQLLTELDGMDGRAGVYVVGATNRPDMIDPAILRPGRLGTNILVDLPDADGRADILRTRLRRLLPPAQPIPETSTATTTTTTAAQDAAVAAAGVDDATIDRVARDERCGGFSGADMDNLHVAAAQAALRRADDPARGGPDALTPADWDEALASVRPSVSLAHAHKFRRLKKTGWE